MKTLIHILASITIIICVLFIAMSIILTINAGFSITTVLYMVFGTSTVACFIIVFMLGVLRNGEL